ncbi:chorismate mutase [Aureimonas leprariae]|uniref:chorismate mutase n=2 Tax=Plantimonas leprariae TaxID=2615207 RepID=A0A7V7PSK2_9HYPH|nr:chorismate mutase [Aureimonas leprariae]
MASLRRLIDAVDDELFDLFAERMACIHRAAEIKARDGIPANVPSRVTEVVNNARNRAEARGLDPDLYGRIWQSIVDASIAAEEGRLGGGGY